MEEKIKKLEEIIKKSNQELVMEAGGTQDAYYDPQWATYEGIFQVDFAREELEVILKNNNENLEKAIIDLKEQIQEEIDEKFE